MSSSTALSDQFDRSSLPKKLFLLALVAGIALRVIGAIWGDIGVYVDGTTRIALAMKWAANPNWHGLSGVWPPAHMYLLGSLIRLWNQPVILAKLISFIFGVATLFVFRNAVRHRFGPTVASLSSLLLAVYWTHIWLTSSYWAEVPYLLFVLLAVNYAERTRTERLAKYALWSGFFLSLTILLRNEGLMLLGIFALWYLRELRSFKLLATFVTLPALLTLWYFVEPAMRGGSYFEYFAFVSTFKEINNLLFNISRMGAVYQWMLMLGAAPTLVVVLPGLYGLWRNRRHAVSDLFAWMFVAQAGFYFFLTLTSAWRPQLRYLMIQFVNLLPYTALIWLGLMRRFSLRYVLAGLLAAMIAMQSYAWWVGRNDRLPGGWLPLQVNTPSQKIIDSWVGRLQSANQPPPRIVSIVPGPPGERWSLEHSFVVNRLESDTSTLNEIDVQVLPEILKGELPEDVRNADILLIDPNAIFYQSVLGALNSSNPQRTVIRVNEHIEAIVLSEHGRLAVAANPIRN